ncbi:MAG: hypothetical protein WC781_01425 [Candidatus Pacearchaeota archaeon]|jgi:predicted acyltransferase
MALKKEKNSFKFLIAAAVILLVIVIAVVLIFNWGVLDTAGRATIQLSLDKAVETPPAKINGFMLLTYFVLIALVLLLVNWILKKKVFSKEC